METEIIERPEGHDFHWFVQDVARAAPRHGYVGMIAPSSYPNNGRAWVSSIGRYNLDLKQLQKDWGACLRGDKEIAEVSSATYCFTNLLIDSGGIRNKTPENAQALSAALKEQYPQEIEKDRRERRTSIEIEVEEAGCCVSPTLAARYLGYKNTSSIRRLRQQKKLRRCKTHSTGKISKASLIAHKRMTDSY